MSRTRSFVRGAASSYFTRSLSIVLGFVVTPIVLGFLGAEKYGVWVIIGTLLGYFGLLDLGIMGSASTLIARKQGIGSGADVSVVASNTMFLHLCLGLAIILLGLIFVAPISNFFGLSDSIGGTATITLALAVLAFGLRFPGQTLKAVLRGTQHIAQLAWIDFSLLLFRTALILTFLWWGFGLPGLPLAGVITSVIALGCLAIAVKAMTPNVSLSVRHVSPAGIRGVFGVSMWWALGGLGALLIYQLDNLVIGKMIGVAAVTSYALTYRLSDIARQQLYQLNFTLMPGVGDLVGRGDTKSLADVFKVSFKTTVGLAIIGGFFLLLFNGPIVELWVGPQHYAGAPLTALFAAFLVVSVVFQSSSVIVTSFLEVRQVSTVRWIEGALNVALSIVLVLKYGVIGAAAATVIAALLTSFWYVPWRAFSLLGINLSDAVRGFMLPLMMLMISVGLTAGLFSLWGPVGFIPVVAACILFLSASAICLFAAVISPWKIFEIVNRGFSPGKYSRRNE